MADIRGGSELIQLGAGYALRAPRLRGRAELIRGGGDKTRARERSTPLLDEALADAGMAGVATVDILVSPTPGMAGVSVGLRDSKGDEAMLLEVPDLGPESGQVVLLIDEAGALSWHFPLDDVDILPLAVRGSGGTKQFLVRSHIPSSPPSVAPENRGLFGAIGRKLLKVIVYPISDALAGKSASLVAAHWEGVKRAYSLRTFTRENFHSKNDAGRWSLTPSDAGRLGEGTVLLFMHGTFSTAHGAFADMPPAVMHALEQAYGGRVIAFDHFTLSHDPRENVERLNEELRGVVGGVGLTFDLVCHSRGGLVARTMDSGAVAFGLDSAQHSVRKAVFVGVPNRGTPLAHPDHMVEMIDRLTSAINLVPSGGVADLLDGLLTAVKIVGHGALNGLDGLRAMDPEGDFLRTLNRASRTDAVYYAVAADYESTDPGIQGLVRRGVDAVIDRVFNQAENDLVVPEAGVYAENGSHGFPVPTERLLRIPGDAGVTHTSLFRKPEVALQIKEWLTQTG